jgi:hypothetical protein
MDRNPEVDGSRTKKDCHNSFVFQRLRKTHRMRRVSDPFWHANCFSLSHQNNNPISTPETPQVKGKTMTAIATRENTIRGSFGTSRRNTQPVAFRSATAPATQAEPVVSSATPASRSIGFLTVLLRALSLGVA